LFFGEGGDDEGLDLVFGGGRLDEDALGQAFPGQGVLLVDGVVV